MNFPKLIESGTNSEIIIEGDSFTIGRSLSCSHVLTNINISRLQAYIVKEGNDWILCDKSSNGTVVNNIKYAKDQTVKLESGSVITLSNDLKYTFVLNQQTPRRANLDDSVIYVGSQKPNPNAIEVIDLVRTPTSQSSTSKRKTKAKVGRPAKIAKKDSDNVESAAQSAADRDKSGSSEELMQESTCSICSELFIETKTLGCQHSFCSFCIDKWTQKNKNCPVCRAKITCSVRTLVVDNIIEKLVNKLSTEEKASREKEIKDRQKAKLKDTSKGASASGVTVTAGRILTRAQRSQIRGRIQPVPIESLINTIEIPSDDDDDVDIDSDMDSSLISTSSDETHDIFPFLINWASPRRNGDAEAHFSGECYICHEEGHWANHCPERAMRR